MPSAPRTFSTGLNQGPCERNCWNSVPDLCARALKSSMARTCMRLATSETQACETAAGEESERLTTPPEPGRLKVAAEIEVHPAAANSRKAKATGW